MKSVVFLEDDYLLRRDSGSKVELEEILDPDTNTTSLDENSATKNLQIHIEALPRFDKVQRQPYRCVRHIVTNDVNTLDNMQLTHENI